MEVQDKDELKQIIALMYEEVKSETIQKGISLSFTEAVSDFILEKGYDPKLGARPLRRAIQEYIEDPLSEELIKGKFKDGAIIKIGRKGDELTFSEKKSDT